jgi:hypothetical protein
MKTRSIQFRGGCLKQTIAGLLLVMVNVAIGLANDFAIPGNISVCFDFSCKTRVSVSLNNEDWQEVYKILESSESALQERDNIKQAIATMEQLVGQYTPTHRDIARNWSEKHQDLAALPGQMDCIDESINTTTYLRLLEQAGLLKFHRVLDRAYRKSLFDQHWAAEVVDIQNGQHYVIDSWFADNGEIPILVKSERWYKLSWF